LHGALQGRRHRGGGGGQQEEGAKNPSVGSTARYFNG
jgi:hypothetical protein